MRYSLLFAVAISFVPAVAFAQKAEVMRSSLPVARDGEVIDSVGSGAIDPVLPVVETDGGISYITGGVGDEEKAALKEQEKNFNVRMLVKSAKGEYMGDLSIRFLDKNNEPVLVVDGAGPYLYANLPVGAYTAEVKSSSGNVKKVKVKASETAKGLVYVTIN